MSNERLILNIFLNKCCLLSSMAEIGKRKYTYGSFYVSMNNHHVHISLRIWEHFKLIKSIKQKSDQVLTNQDSNLKDSCWFSFEKTVSADNLAQRDIPLLKIVIISAAPGRFLTVRSKVSLGFPIYEQLIFQCSLHLQDLHFIGNVHAYSLSSIHKFLHLICLGKDSGCSVSRSGFNTLKTSKEF